MTLRSSIVPAYRLLIFILLAAAGCSGGTSTPSVAQIGTVPFAVGAPRLYSGTRTIEVSGSAITGVPGTPIAGAPGPATYSVSAIERDLAPGTSAPPGTTFVREQQRVYTGAAPASGVYLQSETLDQYIATGGAGLALLSSRDVTLGRDIDAEYNGAGAQYFDTRTVTANFPAGAIIVPATSPLSQHPFPNAFTRHVVESSVTGSGTIAKAIDVTRVTNEDRSYDETGSTGVANSHAWHQHSDYSTAAHDQIPGFYLRDLSISAPSGSGRSASLTVTLQTQGRAVGNPPPPVVTTTTTIPQWYDVGGATATVYDGVTTSSPTACALQSSPVRRLNLARVYLDIAGGTLFVENDENYVDAGGLTLCRITGDSITFSDPVTGAYLGTTTDTITLRFTGLSSTAQARHF